MLAAITAAITIGILLLMAFADWTRGSMERPKFLPKVVCLLLIGWCVAFLLGHPGDFSGLALTGLIAIGGSFGVGNALGPAISGTQPRHADAEWWQHGALLDNSWLSLGVLGILWGAPTLALLPWVPNAWMPSVAFAVAVPSAAWIAIRSVGGPVLLVDDHDPAFARNTKRSSRAWATFNILRSPLAGLIILGLSKL